jgi:hypothetical protein
MSHASTQGQRPRYGERKHPRNASKRLPTSTGRRGESFQRPAIEAHRQTRRAAPQAAMSDDVHALCRARYGGDSCVKIYAADMVSVVRTEDCTHWCPLLHRLIEEEHDERDFR